MARLKSRGQRSIRDWYLGEHEEAISKMFHDMAEATASIIEEYHDKIVDNAKTFAGEALDICAEREPFATFEARSQRMMVIIPLGEEYTDPVWEIDLKAAARDLIENFDDARGSEHEAPLRKHAISTAVGLEKLAAMIRKGIADKSTPAKQPGSPASPPVKPAQGQ